MLGVGRVVDILLFLSTDNIRLITDNIRLRFMGFRNKCGALHTYERENST